MGICCLAQRLQLQSFTRRYTDIENKFVTSFKRNAPPFRASPTRSPIKGRGKFFRRLGMRTRKISIIAGENFAHMREFSYHR